MRSRKLAPRRRTNLPNASTLGYGKYWAEPGDYVTYRSGQSDHVRFGRVLGQIIETPSDGLEDATGWLCIAELANDLTYGYERWINPVDIRTCLPASQIDGFMRAFLSSSVKETLAALDANDNQLGDGRDGKLWTGSPAQLEATKEWARRIVNGEENEK
jgi:hypothetical protein